MNRKKYKCSRRVEQGSTRWSITRAQ